MAREVGTSRQFLCALCDRAWTALAQALAPGQPGRPPVKRRLVIDQVAMERDVVVVLSQVAHASVRGISGMLGEDGGRRA